LKNLEFIKVLPYWAQDLSYKYCSKTTNLYIVHGNIRDFLPNKMLMKASLYLYKFRNLNAMKKTFPSKPIESFLTRNPFETFDLMEKYFLMNIPYPDEKVRQSFLEFLKR